MITHDSQVASIPSEIIDFKKVLFEDKPAIEAHLFTGLLQISHEKLRDAAVHILNAGGKRIRPALMLTSYKAVGGREIDKAIYIATAIELIHNWTLIHDDIIDKSELRRGVFTVHKKWDETTAILAGDMLNNLAYRLVTQSGFKEQMISKALGQIATASMSVIDGELLDVEFENRRDISEEEYFTMIARKTGSLFSASAKIGVMLGTDDEEVIKTMERYGELIGLAFQLQDDLLDITGNGEEFGKEIGKDIMEGKKTLMVLHALHHAKIEKSNRLRMILVTENKTGAQVQEAIEIMEGAGSLSYARQALADHVEEAIERLNILETTSYRMTLEELACFIASRTK